MNPPAAPPLGDELGEIPALIETLLATEERLEQLTAGEVDSVAGRDGRTFLLRRAQEQMQRGEAAKQAAILNALPAHIVLLDPQGEILSVNETWRNFTGAHVLQGPDYAIGVNYLAACDQAGGVGATEAQQVAAGIRAVLAGTSRMFSLEYACAMPTGRLWFLLTVTPMHTDRLRGAVVRQLDITDRKRAESERERFFTLSMDLLCIVGFDGSFQRVNPAFHRMLGYTEAEIYGQPLQKFIHPDDRISTLAEIGRLKSGATTHNFENRYRCKDGTYRWILWTAVPFAQDNTFYGEGHDITVRKQNEEALREKNALIRIAGRITRTGGWAVDVLGEQLFWDDVVYDILEAPRDQVPELGTILARYTDPWRAQTVAALTACMTKGTAFDLEVEILTFKGKPLWVRVCGEAKRAADGTVSRVQGAFQDITERKRVEKSLQRFRALVDQSNDALEVIDPETGRYLDINDRGCVMHGYAREEFLGLRIADVSATIKEADWPAIREDIRLHVSRSNEGIHRRKDGSTFPVEFSSKWVRLDRDYIVSVVRDITERKTTEARLLHTQRIENIGLLAAGVAHDLNNILAPMLMAASLLRTHMTAESDLRMLGMVENGAHRGAALVRQILGFAHASGGEQQLLQVKHVLRDLISIITETFPKSVEFVGELGPELWTIRADPTQIHQVLLNLCINARDAMPQGGRLTLRAGNCRLDLPTARTLEGASPGDWVKLEVSDTGTGIPPEVLARIWEPFFTTKAPGKGTGLGLSTVRGIVERHHGFIVVQTARGSGSTFSLYLPVAEGPANPEHPVPQISAGHGELVLVVDDEESIRDITTAILRYNNYRALVATDGIDGLTVFAQHGLEIRLVITDFNMPRLNGEKFARIARSLHPAVKIIGMSGGEDGRAAAAAPHSYADAFMAKPFSVETLLAIVHRLLAPTTARS
jgi:PAS domain S-box-containing protein